MPHAPCPMSHAPCPMPHAPCLMSHVPCPMSYASCLMLHASCLMPHASCLMYAPAYASFFNRYLCSCSRPSPIVHAYSHLIDLFIILFSLSYDLTISILISLIYFSFAFLFFVLNLKDIAFIYFAIYIFDCFRDIFKKLIYIFDELFRCFCINYLFEISFYRVERK